MNRRILAADDDLEVLHAYRAALSWKNRTVEGLKAFMDKVADSNLLIEDESSEQYELDCVENAADAIDAVREALSEERPYFLALLDMRMPPGLDGLEAAEQIRKLDPRIYIVMITAYSDQNPEEIYKKLQYGFLYFHKPFYSEELIQVCRNFQVAWQREREHEQHLELMKEIQHHKEQNARLTGIREVTSMVLHNMGNALATVEHTSWEIGNMVDNIGRLPQVLEELTEDLLQIEDAESRATQMHRSLEQITQWIHQEINEKLKERSTQLSNVVHHIIEVMEMQHHNSIADEQPQMVTFSALFNSAMLVLRSYANNRQIETRIEIDQALPGLLWPRNRMVQILVNLMKNGFESIAQEHRHQVIEQGNEDYRGQLLIQAHYLPNDTPESVRLTIQDNGAGIAPETQETLFTFGETTKEQGSGVGLHWVRQELIKLQGTITLESAGSGRGALAVVTLPAFIYNSSQA